MIIAIDIYLKKSIYDCLLTFFVTDRIEKIL
jgi:hypothetical protein